MKPAAIVSWSIERRVEPIEISPAVQERVAKIAELLDEEFYRLMAVTGIAAKTISFDSATGAILERVVPAERLWSVIRTDVT